jgi:hypothetical protein
MTIQVTGFKQASKAKEDTFYDTMKHHSRITPEWVSASRSIDQKRVTEG